MCCSAGRPSRYLDVMQLELVAGSHSTAGARDALISESVAELLFGSPGEALGQPLQTAEPRVVEFRGEIPQSIDITAPLTDLGIRD